MLKIRFNPSGRRIDDRICVDPPYARVAHFIVDDIQASVHVATSCIKRLRAVIDGSQPPIECETGNMWTMDADPEWTTLTNEYGHPTVSVRLPTRWLLDAIEKWRQHLIDSGAPLDQ